MLSANLGIRVAARVVDVVFVSLLAGGLGHLIGFRFAWLIATAGIVIAYFTFADAFFGATLGKLAFGLRVISRDGGRPSLKQSLIREAFMLLGALPFIGPLLALASWIWIAVTIRSDPDHQGKHDALAGTRVIRARHRKERESVRELL